MISNIRPTTGAPALLDWSRDPVVDDYGVTWLMMAGFFVPGVPVPGGSKRPFALRRKDGSIVTRPGGSPIINVTDDSGARGKNWRSVVSLAARQAFWGQPLDGVLSIVVDFVMARPKAHFRTGKHAGELRDDAPVFHTVKPDATKLLRSLEDACTGILWRDDCIIADQQVRKIYGAETGAKMLVYALVDGDGEEDATQSRDESGCLHGRKNDSRTSSLPLKSSAPAALWITSRSSAKGLAGITARIWFQAEAILTRHPIIAPRGRCGK